MWARSRLHSHKQTEAQVLHASANSAENRVYSPGYHTRFICSPCCIWIRDSADTRLGLPPANMKCPEMESHLHAIRQPAPVFPSLGPVWDLWAVSSVPHSGGQAAGSISAQRYCTTLENTPSGSFPSPRAAAKPSSRRLLAKAARDLKVFGS